MNFNPEAEIKQHAVVKVDARSDTVLASEPKEALTGIALAQARKAKSDSHIYDDGHGNVYGYEHSEGYFRDGAAGEETSAYIFHHLVWKLELLGDSSFREMEFNGGEYCVSRGVVLSRTGKVLATIQEMKAKLAAREQELGVDDALIENWNDNAHPPQSWYNQDFSTQMQTFRKAVTA